MNVFQWEEQAWCKKAIKMAPYLSQLVMNCTTGKATPDAKCICQHGMKPNGKMGPYLV
jgi:hypothetical protein